MVERGGIEPQPSFRLGICKSDCYHLSIYRGGYPDATFTPHILFYLIIYYTMFLEAVQVFL